MRIAYIRSANLLKSNVESPDAFVILVQVRNWQYAVFLILSLT